MQSLFQTPIGPSPLAWCAIAATVVLAAYAASGKGMTAPEWAWHVQLPDLNRRGRLLVSCLAVITGLSAIAFYLQTVAAQRAADLQAYTNEVILQTAGKSANDLGTAYATLFDDAHDNTAKRCYLESVISARLDATALDPPVIPANIRSEIRRELKQLVPGQPKAGGCYTWLATELTNTVRLRKQQEFAVVGRFNKDPIANRDTADTTYAETTLADLAPYPTPRGWIYLGNTTADGRLSNPALGQGQLPKVGQELRVERPSLVEGSEPDLNQQAPDVTGVYDQPATVRIVKVAEQNQYAYALVTYVVQDATLASEKP
jgi:hypothetical protein